MRSLISLFLTFPFLAGATATPRVLAFESRPGEYRSHGAGYALSVTSTGATLSLAGHTVHMTVAGAKAGAPLEGLDRMTGRANYLLGRDVRASYDLYGRVKWRGVYPGVDVVFHGNEAHLEYDFEIAAEHDPGRIRLAFDGVDELRIDPQGDLILRAGAVEIVQPRPVAYQEIAGRKYPVEAAYWIDGTRHVRFHTGAYDHRQALVIDPEIVFDQVFGGSAQTVVQSMARDTQGNLYVAGMTNSPDFATVNPVQGRLATGPLVETGDAGKTWSTPLLGGSNLVNAVAVAPSAPQTVYAATTVGIFQSSDGGNSWKATAGKGLSGLANAVAVDSASAATLYAGTQQGLFVSTDGAATWRALSGASGQGVDILSADPSQAGTVYASFSNPAALYRSTDFGQSWTQLVLAPPAQAPVPIALVFGQNGTLILGTTGGVFLSADGGKSWTPGANQMAFNNQELVSSPASPDILYLVNLNGLQRSTDGGLTFNAVLPSVKFSQFAHVAADPKNAGVAYAADFNLLYRTADGGQTWSQVTLPYPLSPQTLVVSPADGRLMIGAGTQFNAFVTKWSADGSQVLYSTYLGGSAGDGATAIAVDGSGSAYVTGYTGSPDFPTTSGALQSKLTGRQDVFIAKLSPDGSKLMYSTLLGSTAAQATGIAVDSSGNAVIGGTTPAGLPVTANAFQSSLVAGCTVQIPLAVSSPSLAAFVSKLSPNGSALVYSTLLGGSCATYGGKVAVDAAGNAWITGTTDSPDFPVTKDALQPKLGGGYYDGFLARFGPAGDLGYSTYVGGTGYDAVNAIAFDAAGNIYLAGESGGLLQPASAGAYQPVAQASCPVFSIGPAVYSLEGNALIAKLDPAAHSILRLTYLGAPYCLNPTSIAVDSAGQPWIAGGLNSTAAPQTVNPLFANGYGFLSKFSADFTQLLFSTYFDPVAGLAVDGNGFAYVAGLSTSTQTSGQQPGYVAKIDSTPPAISVDSIANAAPSASPSGLPGIAAGEVLRILGRNIGPASSTAGVVNGGVLATTVAGVQVTFDGVAVPLLSVSAQEIDLVAPFELAGKSATTVQVLYNGAKSNAVQVAVNGLDLQILGVFNEDLSANSATNPAKAGSVMTLYVAGIGPTVPGSRDGQVNAAPYAAPALPLSVSWLVNNPNGRTNLPVTFVGAAPGLAAGIFQVNFVAPQQSVTPLNLVAGDFNSVQFNAFVK